MAKQRYIDTKFWSDSYVVSINPLERYLFMYFLTNEHTNIAGIYELPIRVMAFESGLDESVLPAMLKKFQDDKKVYYIEEWIIICNFPKHQESEKSPKIRDGIVNALNLLPSKIRFAMDTLSIPYLYPSNYLNLNTNKREWVQPTATPFQGLPLSSPIGNEISYVSTDEEGNPTPTKVKKTNVEHKARAEHLVELVAMGKQITGKTFPINFGFGVKILKELEEVAKDGDTYAFGWERVKEEWRALCEEYNTSKFLQEHGFNLGTLKKRITNKGI